MKTWIWICGAVLLAGVTAGGLIAWRTAEAKPNLELPADSYIAPAARGDLVQSVTATGPVASNLDVLIKCRASGEVITLPFDISQSVKKGDLLAQLDQKDEEVLVDRATVNLEQAKSRLTEAQELERQAELDLVTATEQADANIQSSRVKAENLRKKADRQKELLAQNLASPEEYETAQTDAAQAENDLRAAEIAKEQLKSQAVALSVKAEDVNLARDVVALDEIELRNANQQLRYTTIVAPMDGVVSDIAVQRGTMISSAISNVGGGTTILTLSDLSHIFVLASVDESDIGGVKVGQTVDITCDAYPGQHFGGRVVRIATTGVNVTNVVTFQVKVEVVSDNKQLLKPQMTGNVKIVEAERQNVLMVPVLSVFRQNGQSWVTIVNADHSTTDVPVQTGINDGENEEVISGLQGSEQVLVHKNESNSTWNATGIAKKVSAAYLPGGRR